MHAIDVVSLRVWRCRDACCKMRAARCVLQDACCKMRQIVWPCTAGHAVRASAKPKWRPAANHICMGGRRAECHKSKVWQPLRGRQHACNIRRLSEQGESTGAQQRTGRPAHPHLIICKCTPCHSSGLFAAKRVAFQQAGVRQRVLCAASRSRTCPRCAGEAASGGRRTSPKWRNCRL